MGTDSVIYIRTDGNTEISTGHLIRCISIALQLIRFDQKVCFLVSDEESRLLLEKFSPHEVKNTERFVVKTIDNGSYCDLERELPFLLSFLAERGKPRFLLDSYYVTPNYLKAVGGVARVAYLDDLKKFDYPVNLVINYDLISSIDMQSYFNFYSSADKKLLGPSYAPLRSQFSDPLLPFRETAENVLITTGGSDPEEFCAKLVRFLAKRTPLQLHVVIGSLYSDREKAVLNELAQEYSTVRLYEGLTDLAPLMKQCGLAVSAGGTTLYELCAIGLPAISFILADNQAESVKAFCDTGVISCAGDIRTKNISEIYDDILRFLQELSDDTAKRKTLRESMHRLIDGRGAFRIAEALCQL